MTAEEQKKMQALEAENAKLREENSGLQDRLLRAQQTLAKYAQMLFGQKTERVRLPEKPQELTGSLFVQEMDPAEQARLDKETAKAVAEQDKYLSSHKGQYAEAYAARSPWVHRFDLHIAKDFRFNIGSTKHNIQVSASIDNIGNMFNSSWGVHALDCYSTGTNAGSFSPLKYEGVDASNKPIFSMNKVDGAYPTQTYTKYLNKTYECWQVLLGIKYFFN